jgi:hypothetical protein
MAGLQYAVLTLVWDEEQVTPQIAIVWNIDSQMLEDVLDGINSKILHETSEDEGLYASNVVAELRKRGYKVDVPNEIVTFDNWDGAILSDNNTAEVSEDE